MFLGKLGHNYKCTEASGQMTVCVLKKIMRESGRNNNDKFKNSITYSLVLRKIKLRPKHTFIEFFITEV